MSALSVRGLVVAYGRTTAVRDVDLDVPKGHVVSLVGANGAGKTTIMRALSGLVRPRQGRVLLDGRDITGHRAHRIAALGMRQVPEGRQIFSGLTVEENLSLGGYTVRDALERARRRDSVLARFPRLRERLDQVAGLMSGGEQQMLAIGRALMGDPWLLLLDEPSMGLAPLFIEEVFSILLELKREGITILLVEQNASAALEVADYGYVIESGRVALHGEAAMLLRDPAVIAAYLGGQ